MKGLIKERLDVECKVLSSRVSGSVIVARLENEEKKKEIIRNKNKLKGNSYIENDMSWEERKVQKKIGKWAKKQNSKGKEVKIGIGRIKMDGRWRVWADVESEEERQEEEGVREERKEERNRKEQNFVVSQEGRVVKRRKEDRKREEKIRKEGKKKETKLKRRLLFWNITGLEKQNKEFWRYS